MPEEQEQKEDDKIPETQNVIVDDKKQLESLAASMPQPVEEAIDAAGKQEQQTISENKDVFDNKKRPFDPNLHAVDEAGKPLFTATGRFKRKINLPGAKPGLVLPDEKPNPVTAQIKQQAALWADAFIHLGISLCGEEWKPQDIDGKMTERDLLIAANERYMIENGVVALPAWAELCLAYGMYSIKRFNQPKTKTVIQKIWSGTKTFFTNAWLKITGKDFKVVPRTEAKDK